MVIALDKKDSYKRQWNNTDFSTRSVHLSQIIDLSATKDRPQAIDKPRFRGNDQKGFFEDNSPVICVNHGNIARAYPLSLLLYHQVVNDDLDGLELAITYCPLSNSAVVFKRRLGNTLFDFGNSRKVHLSNSLLFDKETQSWWQQYSGTAIVGRYTEAILEKFPSIIIPYSTFKELYPEGLVLTPNKQSAHNYGYSPFALYDSQPKPALYPFPFCYDDLSPMSYVLEIDNSAISLAYLQKHVTVEWGNTLITYKEGMPSVLDSKRIISGKDLGYIELSAIDASKPYATSYHMPFAFVVKALNPEASIFYKDE